MATLDIEGQHVNVDDSFLSLPHDQQQSTVDEIASSLKAKPSVGVGEDLAGVAKTAPQRIISGLAGIPADLAHLYAPNQSDPNPLGTEALGQKMGVYNAQTEPGKLLQKGVDFAPALIGGPETLATKLATRVAAPAVASEVGGAVGGPLGEVAGALAGAGGASAAASKFKAMAAARAGAVDLTAPEIKAASRAGYQHPDVAAVQIKPEAMSGLADKIDQDLQHGPASGFRAANEKPVFDAVDELRTPLQNKPSAPNEPIWYQGVWHGAGDKPVSDYWTTDLNLAKQYSGPNGQVFAARESAFPPNALATRSGKVLSNKEFHPGQPYSVPEVETLGKLPRTAAEQDFSSLMKRPASVADLDNVRQVLGGLAKEKDAIGQSTRQAVAAQRAIGHIDNFLPNLKQPDLLAGDASKANDILQKARGDWKAYKQSSQVQNVLENAITNNSAAHSGGNLSNSIRQAFKPLIKNDFAKVSNYTDEQKDALKGIVGGTLVGNIARTGAKLLGSGGGLGAVVGGEIGYHEGGLPGLVGGALAGKALRKISDRSTFNAVSKLDKMIRAGSPEALKLAAQMPQQAIQQLPAKTTRLLRAMILADPTISQQASQQPSQAQAY